MFPYSIRIGVKGEFKWIPPIALSRFGTKCNLILLDLGFKSDYIIVYKKRHALGKSESSIFRLSLKRIVLAFIPSMMLVSSISENAYGDALRRFITSGNYSDASNWSNSILPQPGDSIIIEQNCNVNISMPSLSSITVNSGATLNLNSICLPLIGSINNNGTISTQSALPNPIPGGISYGGTIEYSCSMSQNIVNAVYNNLTVSGQGNKNLSASVTVLNNLNLVSGTLKIQENTLTVNGAINFLGGSLKGGNTSNLIFNGSGSTISLPEITLLNLQINRPSGILLNGALNIKGNLELINGDIYLNGNTITLDATANLIETPNNTVRGISGSITTTRTLSNISDLNVGGIGAVITTTKNMGVTTITRSHAAMSGNSNSGISRSYNISPANNFDLNASVRFKYDESELNGIPETDLSIFRSTNLGVNWTLRGGVVDPFNNDVFVSVVEAFSVWTAANRHQPLVMQDLNLTALIEGFYNPFTNIMRQDTMKVFLRSPDAPYTIIDSSAAYLSQSGTGQFKFKYAVEGAGYYIQLKHRNALETWGAIPNSFSSSVLNLDISSDPQSVYGANLKPKGSRYVIYGGDVQKDGAVDLSDITCVLNDAGSFQTGRRVTDLNGDELIDLTDLLIVNSNSDAMVVAVTP